LSKYDLKQLHLFHRIELVYLFIGLLPIFTLSLFNAERQAGKL